MDEMPAGVYKSGFATTQDAYESNVVPLFESLDRLEKILDGQDYVVGNTLTEADVRLYTTIIRTDPVSPQSKLKRLYTELLRIKIQVYVGHFKCNLGTIRHNYPNLNRWMKQLYWKSEAFKSTTNFEHIKVSMTARRPPRRRWPRDQTLTVCDVGAGPLLPLASSNQPHSRRRKSLLSTHQCCRAMKRPFPSVADMTIRFFSAACWTPAAHREARVGAMSKPLLCFSW